MPITPASYDANGATMLSVNYDAQCVAALAWLNGAVVTADLGASAVIREHVVRPKFWGVPVNGMIGRLQQRYGYLDNAFSGSTNAVEDVARARDRDSIQPQFVEPVTELWRTRHGTTFYLPVVSRVAVWCHGFVHIRAGSGYTYPAAETGNVVGRLILGTVKRDDLGAGYALQTSSSHEIYPPGSLAGRRREHFSCMSMSTLSAGHHDFLLLYDRNSDTLDDSPFQLDIRTINWSVDVTPAPAV